MDANEKKISGIKYRVEDKQLSNIEFPGKIITVNNSDGIYSLINAKDISWGFVLDQIKKIDKDILDEYKNSYIYQDINLENHLTRYEEDFDDVDISKKPLWYKGAENDGEISNTQELLDLINFILFRSINIDKTINTLLDKFNLREVGFSFSDEIDNNPSDDNPDDFHIIIKPVTNKDYETYKLENNDSGKLSFSVSTTPLTNDQNLVLQFKKQYDTTILSNAEDPTSIMINKNTITSSSDVIEGFTWDCVFMTKGFYEDINEHYDEYIFDASQTMNTKIKEAKRWKVLVSKTPNKIKEIIIGKDSYIYFSQQEINKQLFGEDFESNPSDLLYYPCVISKSLLEKYVGLTIKKENDKYIFKHDVTDESEGTINWFIRNKHIYSYPTQNDYEGGVFGNTNEDVINSIKSKFNTINLKKGVNTTIEIIVEYDQLDCLCKYDDNDNKPFKYNLSILKNQTPSEFLLLNSQTPFYDSENNSKSLFNINYSDNNKGRFIFKISSNTWPDNINGNTIDHTFVLNFETTGTKYLEKNEYVKDKGLNKYIDGNPLSLQFKVNKADTLYIICNNDTEDYTNDTDIYGSIDTPYAKSILNSDEPDFFENSNHCNILNIQEEDGTYKSIEIRPFELRIPIISEKSFNVNDYKIMSARNYTKSTIKYWDKDPLSINKRLFNITNKQNINKIEYKNKYSIIDDDLILNENIEIDYELIWKYLTNDTLLDKYGSNKESIDNSNESSTKMFNINNHLEHSSLSKLKDSINKAKTDYDKGKAIFDYFISVDIYQDPNYSVVLKKSFKCKKITSYEGPFYINNYINDKNRFFIPIIIKIPGKTSGTSILYDDTYFAMHLIITRGKQELKCLTIRKENNILHTLPVIPEEKIEINNYILDNKSIKYSYIYSTDINDFSEGYRLGDNYKDEYLYIISKSEMGDDINFKPKLEIGLNPLGKSDIYGYNDQISTNIPIEQKNEEYEISLNINNSLGEIKCNSIIHKTMTEQNRYDIGDLFITSSIPFILTSDSIFHSDENLLHINFKKNTNLLPLRFNSKLMEAVIEYKETGNSLCNSTIYLQSGINEGLLPIVNHGKEYEQDGSGDLISFIEFELSKLFKIQDTDETLNNLILKEIYKRYVGFEDVKNPDNDNYFNKFKSEIRCCFSTNEEEKFKYYDNIDYKSLLNTELCPDVSLIPYDGDIKIKLNRLENYKYEGKNNIYMTLMLWIPQSDIYTARYYIMKSHIKL